MIRLTNPLFFEGRVLPEETKINLSPELEERIIQNGNGEKILPFEITSPNDYIVDPVDLEEIDGDKDDKEPTEVETEEDLKQKPIDTDEMPQMTFGRNKA